MKDNRNTIKKLQAAINTKFGDQILYDRRQFYSQTENRPVNMYTIRKQVYSKSKGRPDSIVLFKSSSQIQTILYLRDYWYERNGWEVPIDNPEWNLKKAKLGLSQSVLQKELLSEWVEEQESTNEYEE